MKSLITVFLILLASSLTAAQSPPAPIAAAPAPGPAPEYVNLTDLLSVAGPFSTFLNYLESTKVISTFQNQANNTEEGVTIFVPKDQAFTSLNHRNLSTHLSNLTQDQLKSLLLYHAIPRYYALSDFTNLSRQNPVSTFAGSGLYALNFTDNSGTVGLSSGWTTTHVSSAVRAAFPVAVYQVDQVLLPEAIFGTEIPPPAPVPAPAPAPDAEPADQVRGGGSNSNVSSSSSPHGAPSSSFSPPTIVVSDLGLIVACAVVLAVNTQFNY